MELDEQYDPSAAEREGLDVEGSFQELVGGTATTARPEVGRFFNGHGGGCTATLIATRVAVTAAHCLQTPFSDAVYDTTTVNAGSSLWLTGADGVAHEYTVDFIHSFATKRYEYTRSGNMTTDIALLRLATAVPSAVARPARIALNPPRTNDASTIFGFGCTRRDPQTGAGGKQRISFRFGTATTALCPGDSGGPVFFGDGNGDSFIWGINSDYTDVNWTGDFNQFVDVFADLTYYRPQIEDLDSPFREHFRTKREPTRYGLSRLRTEPGWGCNVP